MEQAAAEEMAQLHCMIPDELHHRLRILAAQDRTTITAWLPRRSMTMWLPGREASRPVSMVLCTYVVL